MMKRFFIFCAISLFSIASHAAVILQYHHVSETTPASTSITPAQFAIHMQYLADNDFTIIPLNELVEAIKHNKPLADKTVAITFDDAYLNILTNAKPILDKHQFPFTIFINPGIIKKGSKSYLNWQQLKAMSDDGVLLANHGFEHDSLARVPQSQTLEQWLGLQATLVEKSEAIIKEETGQSWRYFAYPYGEYTPEIQAWLKELNYVGFSQQSGAVGSHTDLTIIPRFPASMPYDKIASLKYKLSSLPFDIKLLTDKDKTIFLQGELTSAKFQVNNNDIKQQQLNCYVTGIGKQQVQWINDKEFSLTFDKPLPTGRVRSNCTAPSLSKPGRYYWYSQQWFILNKDNTWYPL
ncbi:polysaccharide deacetylase family protein [Thalassotalea marina]|uniref:Polysaccharide deacetylase n=1 Tax=Thalassotalea marina TaxID=1673741 RepID=A0A919BN06_9GAMM|nr:polysaccharide deacetylase family protein [Thalassotalea marina]GHF99683.1 polysaccharide deacetylase [Thalassotalea marina]